MMLLTFQLPPYAGHIVTAIYVLILIYTVIRILLDTPSTPKTLGYLLLLFALPILGIVIYYSLGINYRHHKSTERGISAQEELDAKYLKKMPDKTQDLLQVHGEEIGHFKRMVSFISGLQHEILSLNKFQLLVNGEEKFPEVLNTLNTAQNFIHMEYYDWENDVRGNQIKEVLLNKVKQGVVVRVMYDDYASKGIRHNIVKELKKGGIQIYPKIKVKLAQFANRMNHRDHRKLIIVDGIIGFVGGINISDRYDNSIDTGLYWRDTHVKITGQLAANFQRHFIVSWNSCQPNKLEFTPELFPVQDNSAADGIPGLAQVVAGGPIYPKSNIMLSYFRIFSLAKEKLYVTNPYFIPSESIMNALMQAAISGVDVRLMVPEKSDSAVVGAASKFYFGDLLNAGVRIFLYKKGFVHAKTVVADQRLSVVGTANMDIRSFDLNFEIMSVIYGREFATQLEDVYLNDLKECREIILEEWKNKGILTRLTYSIARLVSSFL
ncbi:cardiolipin synthase [Eudoraea sp.]|uniref:cardiolipin synthase n=1 Tax=Eudoraea sp. TaxID=1979955 RepID=UPI003C740233